MGLFACLSECLSTRTSTSVYFVRVYSIFKLCICFAHELMCMWFGHSSFFIHLMNILTISDTANGCFHEHTTSSNFIISGAFLSFYLFLYPVT